MVVFQDETLHRELGSGEFELGLVDEEEAEGEKFCVAVPVGAAALHLDRVVHSFARAGRVRTQVERQSAVLGLLDGVAEATGRSLRLQMSADRNLAVLGAQEGTEPNACFVHPRRIAKSQTL